MDAFGGLLGGPWLQACTSSRPKSFSNEEDDLVQFDGAPEDRKMRAAVLHSFGDSSEIYSQKIPLPLELVLFNQIAFVRWHFRLSALFLFCSWCVS
jgi:hypothetical protein